MPIYMKIKGYKGTGKGKYEGWIVLNSCQFGSHRGMKSPVGQKTKLEETNQIHEIIVTKYLDESSEKLFRLSAWGETINITVHFTNADSNNAFLIVELDRALIVSYSTSPHDEKQTESILISPLKINIKSPCAPGPSENADWRTWSKGDSKDCEYVNPDHSSQSWSKGKGS